VTAAGKPLSGAGVTLYAGSVTGVSELGRATTAASGSFVISYTSRSAGVLYVDAVSGSRLRLRAVVGVGGGGGIGQQTLSNVKVDELTTVAAGYALAQFSTGNGVAGPSPGLENAAATAFALANSGTGTAGGIVTNANNGSNNETLATVGTLANLVSTCAAPAAPTACGEFLHLATPPGGGPPVDTVQALVDLARNPTSAPAALYALTRSVRVYAPALSAPPSAWILALRYTEPDLYASGRIAFDSLGRAWSSDNWLPGTQNPSPFVTVLDPSGQPTLGSPITGGGMKAGAWGIAITPQGTVWVPSFGGDAMSQYSPSGTVLSPSTGWTNGNLVHPQGVAVDQKGNVWIANNYGPESAPDQGDIVVYPGGNPAKAITISGGGLNHPFAVQIDGYGRAWVTNAGLGGAKLVGTKAAIFIGKFAGSVTVINPDFKPTSFSPIQDPSFKFPLGLAIDSENNAWAVNYFGSSITQLRPDGAVAANYKLPSGTLPWSEAVDGSDRVWVVGFAVPHVWELCGVNVSACPPGSSTGQILSPKSGFSSKAIQHVTSIQIDQSGNVWVSNNWSQIAPPAGGVGVDEIIGAATPVCTPLQPLPQRPAATGTPCPQQTATPLPASLDATSSTTPSGVSAWAWIAIGVAAAAVAAGATLLIRRRSAPVG
jgi:streptogramin lyase